MAKFTPPFAFDGERRITTSDEQEYGIPCGPFDRPMWHGLFHDVQAELGNLISASGQEDSETDLFQAAKAIQSGKLNYAVAGGTANALTVTLDPIPDALKTGMVINVAMTLTNTGTATINVNGLGAVPIKRLGSAPLNPGDLAAGAIVSIAFDGANFQVTSFNPSTSYAKGSLIAKRTFTTSGIYTPTIGTQSILVIVTGGGGAGGSTQATTSAMYAIGGGGAGGDTQIAYFTSGFSGLYMTIGAGGTPGANVGNPGGTSSFGPLVTSPGGAGGALGVQVQNVPAVQSGGVAISGAGGNISHFSGGGGSLSVGTNVNNFIAGAGGATYWGSGASARWTATFNGTAGNCYGAGGSGGGCTNAPTIGTVGGAGAAGVIYIEEYA